MTLCVGGALDGMDSNKIASKTFGYKGSFINHDFFTYRRSDGCVYKYKKERVECKGVTYFIFSWQHKKINPVELLIQGYKK